MKDFANRLMLVLAFQIPTGMAMSAPGYGVIACFVGTVVVGAAGLFSIQNLLRED